VVGLGGGVATPFLPSLLLPGLEVHGDTSAAGALAENDAAGCADVPALSCPNVDRMNDTATDVPRPSLDGVVGAQSACGCAVSGRRRAQRRPRRLEAHAPPGHLATSPPFFAFRLRDRLRQLTAPKWGRASEHPPRPLMPFCSLFEPEMTSHAVARPSRAVTAGPDLNSLAISPEPCPEVAPDTKPANLLHL